MRKPSYNSRRNVALRVYAQIDHENQLQAKRDRERIAMVDSHLGSWRDLNRPVKADS
jgi:hypothetical protein